MTALMILLIIVATYIALDWLIHLPKVTKYTQKYIVITGCDDRFGKLLAHRLDLLGFNVFAGCQSEKDKDALATVCSSRVTPALLDVTDGDSVQTFLNFVQSKLPANTGVWGLANCVNIYGNDGHAELLTREDFQKVLDVNLLGLMEVTRVFLPLIRKSHGRVVNLSGVNGRLGFLHSPYTVSKFGLEAFSDVLRQEVYRQRINVSLIEPDAIHSIDVDTDGSTRQKDETKEKTQPVNPRFLNFFGVRSADVNDVIEAYVHALTAKLPRSRYVMGWNAKLITCWLCHLPDFITDRVIQGTLRSPDPLCGSQQKPHA